MGAETPTREPRRACMITVVHQPFDVRIFHKQARTLAQSGWDVTLIAPSDRPAQEVDGVRILGLPRAPRWRRPLNWLRALRLALRHRADVYHIHDPELLLIAPLIRVWAGRPLIYDAHEILSRNVRLKEWLPAVVRPWLGYLAGLGEGLLSRATSAVICVTGPQFELYERIRGRPPILLVRNYPWRDYHGDATAVKREPVVIFVGGLTGARGVTVLLQAFASVAAQVSSAQLWLVGPAEPPSYETLMRERLVESGLTGVVKLFGRVPFPQVRELLSQSAVGVVTYLPLGDYSQSLPTKLFEYMATGLPCVCSNIPLWADIVEQAACGLIVDPTDASAVAEAIIHLLEHPEEAAEMGRRGREAFLAHYTWEQEGEKLVALYQQLAGGQRQQGGESSSSVR